MQHFFRKTGDAGAPSLRCQGVHALHQGGGQEEWTFWNYIYCWRAMRADSDLMDAWSLNCLFVWKCCPQSTQPLGLLPTIQMRLLWSFNCLFVWKFWPQSTQPWGLHLTIWIWLLWSLNCLFVRQFCPQSISLWIIIFINIPSWISLVSADKMNEQLSSQMLQLLHIQDLYWWHAST